MLKKICLKLLLITFSFVSFSQCPIINGINVQQIQDQGNGNCVYVVNYNYTSVANNKSIQIVASCNGTQVLSQCITVNICNNCTASSSSFTCACSSTKAVTITTYNNNGCGGGGTCTNYTLAGVFLQETITNNCITWATENSSISKFEIEESNDGLNFILKHSLAYSTSKKDYIYCINNSSAIYFRIKAILTSGKEEYSKILKSTTTNLKNKVWYNAANKLLTITPSGIYNYAIYNLDGREVLKGISNNSTIQIAALYKGNYIIRLQQKSGIENLPFVVY